MKKRVVSFVLALCMVVGLCPIFGSAVIDLYPGDGSALDGVVGGNPFSLNATQIEMAVGDVELLELSAKPGYEIENPSWTSISEVVSIEPDEDVCIVEALAPGRCEVKVTIGPRLSFQKQVCTCEIIVTEVDNEDDSADDAAYSGVCGNNLTWSLSSDGELTIQGTGKMPDFSSDAPETQIPWSYTNTGRDVDITRITIEDGVTSIGDYAFSSHGCGMTLVDVSIPDSVTRIGNQAFFQSSSLEEIDIPDSVRYIGIQAFYQSGIRNLVLPAGLKSIESGAFFDSQLESITIPTSVRKFDLTALYYCDNLSDVYYEGNSQQWDAIETDVSLYLVLDDREEDSLSLATIHFTGDEDNPPEDEDPPEDENSPEDENLPEDENPPEENEPIEDDGKLPFRDVSENAWYADAVRYVYKNGLMAGTGSNTFNPNGYTTRGQLVTILYRLEGTPYVSTSADFSDINPKDYFYQAVRWAFSNGIVTGTGGGRFSPNQAITRQDLATILHRYAKYKEYDTSRSNGLSLYSDAARISAYARTPMQWANAMGLITGTSSTMLSPTGKTTRCQIAAILQRFCENVVGTKNPAETDKIPVEFKHDGKTVFTLYLPGYWAGDYNVYTSETVLTLYDKGNAEAGFGGKVLGIRLCKNKDEYTDLSGNLLAGHSNPLAHIVFQGIAYDVVPYRATDVQYDYNNPELRESYNKKMNDRDEILNSIVFSNIDSNDTPTPTNNSYNSFKKVLQQHPKSKQHSYTSNGEIKYYNVDTTYAVYDIDKDSCPELIVCEDMTHYYIYRYDGTAAVCCKDPNYSLPYKYWAYSNCLYAYDGNGILVHDGGNGHLHMEYIVCYSLVGNTLKGSDFLMSTDQCSYEDIRNYLNNCTPINDFYLRDDDTGLKNSLGIGY